MRLIQQRGQILHYVRYSPPNAQGSPCCSCGRFSLARSGHCCTRGGGKGDGKKIISAPAPGAVVDAPAAVAAVPAAVAKIAGAVIGAPAPMALIAKAPVAKKAKMAKDSVPVMADVATPAPVPVAKAKAAKKNVPGPFHPSGVMVEIFRTVMGDRSRSCESIDCCHVGFLPRHMVKHVVCYDGVLAQVTRVFSDDPTCSDSAERRMFHKNKGCCLAVIIAWRNGYND
jgi:hypothetical protein